MDTSDVEITFDLNGYCNHCSDYFSKIKKNEPSSSEKQAMLNAVVAKIRKEGANKEYDSILGVSGGVDSSYMAYKAKELGLRPLIIHLDNGWNSELAVMNIENIVSKLGFDLYTKVLDWEEFRDMQVSYLKASVLDLEALSDHAIMATLYQQAAKYGVRYILAGTNTATEAILPESYRYDFKNIDAQNIRAIHKQFGTNKHSSYPFMGVWRFIYYTRIRKIQYLSMLDLFDYNKDIAKSTIIEKIGWRDYGGKHHESIITRFYQSYILPVKFGIDKRKAHLSTLIVSGQITRDQALSELQKDICDPQLLKDDLEYVPKKLGLTKDAFDSIMKLPAKRHEDYPNEKKLFQRLIYLKNKIQGR
jgi:N-acetyl sugar amidotransferase